MKTSTRLLILLISFCMWSHDILWLSNVCLAEVKKSESQTTPSESVVIVDAEGRTQSLVELQPDGRATVTAVISRAADKLASKGTPVSLVRITKDGKEELVDTVTTLESGEVTFFNVPGGKYKLRVECDQFEFVSVEVTSKQDDEDAESASKGVAGVSESKEYVTIVDTSGTTRAVRETAPGDLVNATVEIKSKLDDEIKGQRVTLVEQKDGKDIDVFQARSANKKGIVDFEKIPGGTYKLKVECNYNVQGYQLGGTGVLSILCPGVP